MATPMETPPDGDPERTKVDEAHENTEIMGIGQSELPKRRQAKQVRSTILVPNAQWHDAGGLAGIPEERWQCRRMVPSSDAGVREITWYKSASKSMIIFHTLQTVIKSLPRNVPPAVLLPSGKDEAYQPTTLRVPSLVVERDRASNIFSIRARMLNTRDTYSGVVFEKGHCFTASLLEETHVARSNGLVLGTLVYTGECARAHSMPSQRLIRRTAIANYISHTVGAVEMYKKHTCRYLHAAYLRGADSRSAKCYVLDMTNSPFMFLRSKYVVDPETGDSQYFCSGNVMITHSLALMATKQIKDGDELILHCPPIDTIGKIVADYKATFSEEHPAKWSCVPIPVVLRKPSAAQLEVLKDGRAARRNRHWDGRSQPSITSMDDIWDAINSDGEHPLVHWLWATHEIDWVPGEPVTDVLGSIRDALNWDLMPNGPEIRTQMDRAIKLSGEDQSLLQEASASDEAMTYMEAKFLQRANEEFIEDATARWSICLDPTEPKPYALQEAVRNVITHQVDQGCRGLKTSLDIRYIHLNTYICNAVKEYYDAMPRETFERTIKTFLEYELINMRLGNNYVFETRDSLESLSRITTNVIRKLHTTSRSILYYIWRHLLKVDIQHYIEQKHEYEEQRVHHGVLKRRLREVTVNENRLNQDLNNINKKGRHGSRVHVEKKTTDQILLELNVIWDRKRAIITEMTQFKKTMIKVMPTVNEVRSYYETDHKGRSTDVDLFTNKIVTGIIRPLKETMSPVLERVAREASARGDDGMDIAISCVCIAPFLEGLEYITLHGHDVTTCPPWTMTQYTRYMEMPNIFAWSEEHEASFIESERRARRELDAEKEKEWFEQFKVRATSARVYDEHLRERKRTEESRARIAAARVRPRVAPTRYDSPSPPAVVQRSGPARRVGEAGGASSDSDVIILTSDEEGGRGGEAGGASESEGSVIDLT
jgi:hypothetical protein